MKKAGNRTCIITSPLSDFKSQGVSHPYKSWTAHHVWETTVSRIFVPRAMAYIRRFFIMHYNVHVLIVKKYSRTPLFRTRLIRSPRYFEGRSNSLGFTLMFSVIYYQLFRTRLFRIPRYFELIVLSLHLKSTPLFRTCRKQSTYTRAQLETYCILFELVLRN